MTMTLAMPMPPTSSATPPSPSSNAVSVLSTSFFALMTSDGRETCTSPGLCGFAVAGSTARTGSTWAGSVTTNTLDGATVASKSRSAIGRPMNAAVSRFGYSGAGARMPTTENHVPLT